MSVANEVCMQMWYVCRTTPNAIAFVLTHCPVSSQMHQQSTTDMFSVCVCLHLSHYVCLRISHYVCLHISHYVCLHISHYYQVSLLEQK